MKTPPTGACLFLQSVVWCLCLPLVCDNAVVRWFWLCSRVLVVHSDGSEEVVEIKSDLGLKADDVAEMRRRLVAQGVRDIARIELSA